MSFLSFPIPNVYNAMTLRSGEIINFKKYRFKYIYSNLTHLKYFSLNRSHRVVCSNTSNEKPMLYISQYTVKNLRNNYFKPRIQKFVVNPLHDLKGKGLPHKSLISSLQKIESVTDQIEVFNSSAKLPDQECDIRSSICRKLEEILKPYYSSCTVHLVGSSVNGLGLKGCDVDLSLQYPHVNDNQELFHGNADFHEEISEGKLPTKKLYNFSYKVQLLSIRKILQNAKFEEPITVIPGRCPILSFCHQNLSCDLAINNSSAFHGTYLMLLCGKLDERVPKLVRIISYWGKHFKLIGGLCKFKSYALFLLVIYFLQTRSPPVLPAVNTMFEKTDFMKNLQNWSFDVEMHLKSFERSENTQSVEELLKEFFFFYENFDFSYIVCPVSSSSIDRKSFASKFDCENSFALNTICIQDPINSSWNVTTDVSWKHCKSFLKALMSVCEKYQDSKGWIPGSNTQDLTSLFDVGLSNNKRKDLKEFTIDIPLCSAVENLVQCNLEELVKRATASVKHILNYCLLFQCHLVNFETNLSFFDIPQNVRSVIESQFLISETYPDITRYLCITKDTWSGRNTFSVPNNAENSLENECMISKKIDSIRESSEKELFYFLCECCTVHSENGIHLQIKLNPLSSNRFIPKLAIFLKDYIPKFMDKCYLDTIDK